ncbi:MAG: cobalamin-independent methionine synthase II family protein [Verrucomicrobiota bacterium]
MSRLIPTSVVGSYAQPGWYAYCLQGVRDGTFGPTDLEEFLNDAVDTAIRDQEDAGVDIISDGEQRRVGLGFFTAAFYHHLEGLETIPHGRNLGAKGHDQQHKYRASQKLSAPDGLGCVKEWQYASKRATREVKALLPGPYTLAGRISRGESEVYKTREEVAWDFVPILKKEIQDLVDAGITFLQLDEPSPAIHPGKGESPFAELLNACMKDVKGIEKVKTAVHLCFGNNLGRAVSKRAYRPVLDQILRFDVDQLLLEFANRELQELEVVGEIAPHKEVAVGLLDVKNYYIESPEDMAERIRETLKHMPAERLTVIPDCGFSETARWVSRRKMFAMVEGARIVREELTGVKEESLFDYSEKVEVSQTHAKDQGGSCC